MSVEQQVTIDVDGETFLRMCRMACKGQRGRSWTAYLTGWAETVGLRIGRNELQIPASVSRPFSATLNVGSVRSLVQAKDPSLCSKILLQGVQATFGPTADLSFEVRAFVIDPEVQEKKAARQDEQRTADAVLNKEVWAVDVTKGLQGEAVPNAVASVEAATEALYWLGVRRDDIVALVKRVRRG